MRMTVFQVAVSFAFIMSVSSSFIMSVPFLVVMRVTMMAVSVVAYPLFDRSNTAVEAKLAIDQTEVFRIIQELMCSDNEINLGIVKCKLSHNSDHLSCSKIVSLQEP